MSAEHGTAPEGQPGTPGWGGPAEEEHAELETLRDEADRAAAEAARTIAELTGRLSPRNIVASRRIALAAAGNRVLKRATAGFPRLAALGRPPALPVAVALAVAAAAILTLVAVKKRSG